MLASPQAKKASASVSARLRHRRRRRRRNRRRAREPACLRRRRRRRILSRRDAVRRFSSTVPAPLGLPPWVPSRHLSSRLLGLDGPRPPIGFEPVRCGSVRISAVLNASERNWRRIGSCWSIGRLGLRGAGKLGF